VAIVAIFREPVLQGFQLLAQAAHLLTVALDQGVLLREQLLLLLNEFVSLRQLVPQNLILFSQIDKFFFDRHARTLLGLTPFGKSPADLGSYILSRMNSFKQDLPKESAYSIFLNYIVFGDCYAMNGAKHLHLRDTVAEHFRMRNFHVYPNEVIIVGSAKLGFSIAPDKRYKPFSETSDIDIAIAEEIADLPFFDNHRIFSANDIRRMNDLKFVLTLIITIMSTYFSRDEALEEYLMAYNDEFELEENLRNEISEVLLFVEKCDFGSRSRVWKITDLLNLAVELHRLIIRRGVTLEPRDVAKRLDDFYYKVDNYNDVFPSLSPQERLDIGNYQKAVLQGTNDRVSRTRRGEIIQKVIMGNETPSEETSKSAI
jgi:hypothetical protein